MNQRINMSTCSFVPTVSNDAAVAAVHTTVPGMKAVTGSILVTGEQTTPLG